MRWMMSACNTVLDLSYNAASIVRGDTDVKKLTVGLAREWMIALIVVCIVILVLIGIATWWVA
jgi:CHASE3 domain sensor protein